DLAVVAAADGVALQGPRRRAFKVDAADLEAAAVAGALELLVALEPVGRAAQVRAGGAQGVEGVAAAVVAGADDPGAQFLEALDDLAVLVLVGRAGLEDLGRLGQDVGE